MSIEEALGQLPERLRRGLTTAYTDGGNMVNALMQRDEMEPVRALMAGLAMDSTGRELFESALDQYVIAEQDLPEQVAEVIIGGGAHAAIWASARRAKGAPEPLVLDRFPRFGGTFAMTRNPSFFLNSRNRPGPIGAAGSRDALNVILGAPMQPSDMSGSEYQANADIGLVVRCTLALNSVVRQANVTEVIRTGDSFVVVTDRGNVRANRVVLATGIGRTRRFVGTRFDNKQLFSFRSFMARFDKTMFPLRNLGRVAVAGAGDSGRTVVEALTGYGPYLGGSVVSLDYVPQIDWYGVGENMTKEEWLRCNRTRYKPLAALFPRQDGTATNARVVPRERVGNLAQLSDGIQINGRTYDTVIVCVGFVEGVAERVNFDPAFSFDVCRTGIVEERPDRGLALGRANDDRSVVVVGPAAELAFESEDLNPKIEQNKVALFRLAPRTAALASLLPV